VLDARAVGVPLRGEMTDRSSGDAAAADVVEADAEDTPFGVSSRAV
jgi:hypothetical protein